MAIKKHLTKLFFILGLFILPAALVLAVPPASEYEPGATLNPDCAPGSTNCTVDTLWNIDTVNDYVYNLTDKIGIGTSTPSDALTIFGGDIDLENEYDFVGGQNLQTFNEIQHTVNGGSALSGTSYVANEFNFILDTTATTSGYNIIPSNAAVSANTFLEGAGDKNGQYFALAFNNYQGGTGDVSFMRGIEGSVGVGLDSSFDLFSPVLNAGDVSVAQGASLSVVNYGNGVVSDAVGILISAGADSVLGGSGSVTNASGLYADSGNFVATGDTSFVHIDKNTAQPVMSGANVYGFHVDDGSLSGSSSEYGLYINDDEAENYFRNGARFGADGDATKIDNATNGASSTTLYIGNSTIDVTAPSDERTKENIIDTTLDPDQINGLRLVDFTYKQDIVNDNNQQHYGVLAQQVQEVYPYAVKERSDGFLMVDYTRFIPLIIKSVQSLQDQMTERAVDLIDGVREIFVKKVGTEQLCIGDVCFDEEEAVELKALINSRDEEGDSPQSSHTTSSNQETETTDNEESKGEEQSESEATEEQNVDKEETPASDTEESEEPSQSEEPEQAVESPEESNDSEEEIQPDESPEEEVQEEPDPETVQEEVISEE
jgi:hypothetical protein